MQVASCWLVTDAEVTSSSVLYVLQAPGLSFTFNTIAKNRAWSYVALTYDSVAGELTSYLNGHVVEQHAATVDFGSVTDDGYLFIGRHPADPSSNYWPDLPGQLACFEFYDAVLTARQLQKLVVDCKQTNPLTSKCCKPLDHYHFFSQKYGCKPRMGVCSCTKKISKTCAIGLVHTGTLKPVIY